MSAGTALGCARPQRDEHTDPQQDSAARLGELQPSPPHRCVSVERGRTTNGDARTGPRDLRWGSGPGHRAHCQMRTLSSVTSTARCGRHSNDGIVQTSEVQAVNDRIHVYAVQPAKVAFRVVTAPASELVTNLDPVSGLEDN